MSGGLSVVAIDPGETTGIAWCCLGNREVQKIGWQKALLNASSNRGSASGEPRLVTAEIHSSLSEEDHVGQVMAWIQSTRNAAIRVSGSKVMSHNAIVIEDFILRERTKSRDLLTPVRLTAAIRFGIYSGLAANPKEYERIVLQSPSDAKSVVTDERLKRWDLWQVGSTHKRDAIRHLIKWLRENT